MGKELVYPVITISREYAACGRTIAAGLSERLGIPYYDKDFVKETAKKSGYSEEDISREGEAMSRASRILNRILNNAAVYTSSFDGIFKAQAEVVLELAEKPCIIVGRCADYILTNAEVPCFRIFLYADEEHRRARAAQLAENEGQDIAKAVAKHDANRENYYKQYTGRDMGDVKNFDICLDTGKIGVERCIDILCEILEK